MARLFSGALKATGRVKPVSGLSTAKPNLSRSRPCPKCEAKKDQPCFNSQRSLYPVPMKSTHKERNGD